jgi:transcriptional regulator with XRE-family HTH domain
VATEAMTTSVTRTTDLRERMQIARIQNRLTVHELAQRVRCDVETLAAFERGEGLVADDVQMRIVAALRLT